MFNMPMHNAGHDSLLPCCKRDEMLLRGILPEHQTLVDKAKSCPPVKKHVQHAYAQCRARFFNTLLQT